VVDPNQVFTVEENVLIADFPAETDVSDDMFERVNERFETLACRSDVDTHVSILQMDDALNSEMFSRAQEAAEAGKAFGITTWIVVSEGIKKMALRSQVEAVSGVEIETVDTREEAMELAAQD
jgi:hypothetical protein